MRFWIFLATVLVLLPGERSGASAGSEPFSIRGYYITFMRMPTFGLPEWKQMIDCARADGVNTLILWTAGAFRSQQFPITWKYNADHKNVQSDFMRELIDYAHTRDIRVLLGFTPFAYDGVNQFTLEHPELKATQKNGQPAHYWGMHSWGYNLCAAKPAAQDFMRRYVHEMFFDFYSNADGLMIESSDYAICYCTDCGARFFEHEFAFVRQISDEVWRTKTNAMIMVYPSYFNGGAVPGFGVRGARQGFDPRWTLFFTPHSAHIDDELLKQARGSVYSDQGLTLGTPTRIRDAARLAREHRLSGYMPSCEPFSCQDGPPGSDKPRQKPFHFEWLRDGQMPLNELLVRANRVAYREYAADPTLGEDAFRSKLGKEIFGEHAHEQQVADLLFLQDCWFNGADWFSPAPLLNPTELKRRAAREEWPADRMQGYTARVERLRGLVKRYAASTRTGEWEMARIATLIVQRWDHEQSLSK